MLDKFDSLLEQKFLLIQNTEVKMRNQKEQLADVNISMKMVGAQPMFEKKITFFYL